MASGLYFTLLLCLSCGLWIGTEAGCRIKAGGNSACPSGWSWHQGCCFQFVNIHKDWAGAEEYCISLNGNLASVHDKIEYTFIRDLIHKTTGADTTCWVGGYDAVKEGVWMWSDGSKFDYIFWHAGEPNNVNGGENCMDINLRGMDYVNDERCDTILPFVCAKEA